MVNFILCYLNYKEWAEKYNFKVSKDFYIYLSIHSKLICMCMYVWQRVIVLFVLHCYQVFDDEVRTGISSIDFHNSYKYWTAYIQQYR